MDHPGLSQEQEQSERARAAAPGEGGRVLGALFRTLPIPMAVLHASGHVLEANAAWAAGAPDADGCGGRPGAGFDYVRALDTAECPEAGPAAAELRRVLSGGAGTRQATLTRPAGGRLVIRMDPAEADDGRRVLVTQWIVEEAAAAADVEPARRREEREALFDHSSDGILFADASTGEIQNANQRAADLFGYAIAELRGFPLVRLLTEEELESDPIDLDAVRSGSLVVKERQGLRRDGRRITVEMSVKRLSGARLLAVVRDVTARKRRATALRRQAGELAERVKEQRTLYAVSRLLQADDALDTVLTGVVEALPDGWQHPDLADARITLDGRQYSTAGFSTTEWRQWRELVVDGRTRGLVEVVYREAPPKSRLADERPARDGVDPVVFLPEEEELLGEVTARLAEALRRREAEDRLRRSEAYYRTLTEKAVDMVTIANADGSVRYASPSFREVLGFTPEQRMGRSLFENVHPDDRAAMEIEFARALESPAYQPTVTFRIRAAGGDWRILESTGRNLLGDPAIEGVIIESRDITERRAAEEQIRLQAHLLDSVGQAVVASDVDGAIIYWNRAAEAVYGWGRDEIRGRKVSEMLQLQSGHSGSRALREAIGQREAWVGEVEVRRPDGTLLPLLIADEPLVDEAGAFAGYVAVATDLTDLKAAEQAVRESEQRLRSLAENSSDLTVLLDREGRITYSSPNRYRVLGEDAEEALGQVFDPAGPSIHPADRERAAALWQKIMTEPRLTVSGQLRVRHGDGSWRLLEVHARNLLDQPGVEGIVVNARDATERAQLEQQLQQSQKMEAVGRLAGGIAHDFNNLLTGIRGYSQLGLEALPPDHPVHPYLEEVDRAADRAAGLTRQLLAFSRSQVMQPRVVDPNRAVAGLRSMLARLIGEDVRLVTEGDPAAGHVHVDPGQLEQVIVNLVVNARDAMPRGGVLEIRTRGVTLGPDDLVGDASELEPGDYVELVVRDSGAGMSAEVLERVFEPFFTTKEMGKGTGLGLSTVYGIVRQSGGLIRVESQPGDGSTFRVLFPRVYGEEDLDTDDRSSTPAPGDAAETVLLVEDDDAVRGLAVRVLHSRGYRVLPAGDGGAGIRRFEEARAEGQRIDLVLTDVVMPGLGGRELAERVQALAPDLPVILMSGYTDDVLVRYGVDKIGAAFLEKPFTPADLVDCVRSTLEASAARRGSD